MWKRPVELPYLSAYQTCCCRDLFLLRKRLLSYSNLCTTTKDIQFWRRAFASAFWSPAASAIWSVLWRHCRHHGHFPRNVFVVQSATSPRESHCLVSLRINWCGWSRRGDRSIIIYPMRSKVIYELRKYIWRIGGTRTMFMDLNIVRRLMCSVPHMDKVPRFSASAVLTVFSINASVKIF